MIPFPDPVPIYCDFILLPCSTACMNTTHSPGHKQQQSFSPASVRSFVTSSDVCLPISRPQSRTCSGDKHTISSPDMFNILCTVSLQSQRAYGITTHDCMFIRIPNVSLFFTSKHAAQMATGMDDNVPPNVGLGTFLGRTVD